MKRPAHIKSRGPYRCESRADGTIIVTPAWPQFPKWTEEDGGGPGLLSRLALADDLERWLNSVYPEELQRTGKAT